MTAFILVCAAMLAAALLWITLPLLRARDESAATEAVPHADSVSVAEAAADAGEAGGAGRAGKGRLWSAAVAVCVTGLAVAMYLGLSNWNWQAVETAQRNEADMDTMLAQLEEKLEQHPQDVTGWLLLGRSNATLERYANAVKAYQHAYDLTRGENVDAVVGLAEAMVMVDEASLGGRAGQLFDQALAKAPNNPKALWYSSVGALRNGNLSLARERLQLLLAQDPPQQLRTVLEREIQDLDQQLGRSGGSAGPPVVAAGTGGAQGQAGQSPGQAQVPAAAGQQRAIRVSVTLAPEIQKRLGGPLTLFVLARDPAAPGPPLAAQRRSSSEIPLTVELTERDAMMPARSIANAARVEVVARLSQSGTPQARSGDFFGSADYDFSKDTGTLNIVIDRTVP